MIDIELNGQPYRLAGGCTLLDLARELAVADKAVALAVERQVVPRPLWTQRQLQPGQKVDVVHAIGGG